MTRSMSGSPLSRRAALSAAILGSAAMGAGLLAGCSAGQITQTDSQVAAVPGISADSADGQIAIREGLVPYAGRYEPGALVPLEFRIFNRSRQEVRLTGATSGRGQVVLVGEAPGATAAPSPTAPSPTASSASPNASGSRRPNGSASASAAATASATAPASPTPPTSARINVPIPAGEYVLLTIDAGTYLAIAQLQGKELRGGESIEGVSLTFSYSDGTTTTVGPLDVSMAVPLSPLPKPSGAAEH